jgi:hypothetical protein
VRKWGNAGRQVEHLEVLGTRFMGSFSTVIIRENSTAITSWREYMQAPAAGQEESYQPFNRMQNMNLSHYYRALHAKLNFLA